MQQWFADAADAVGFNKLGDAIEAGLGGVFLPVLDEAAENALQWLGPEAGRVASEQMIEKFPALKKAESVTETAARAASDAVMSFHDDIMDFAQDALTNPLQAWKEVGVMMLRACREAAKMAVEAVFDNIPGCCCLGWLLNAAGNLAEIIQSVFEVIVDALKNFIHDQLSAKGVPDILLNQINWDFSEDDDIGEPPKRRGVNQEEAPEPEVMGAVEEES
mmetsp:Transcript_64455/g.171935  ORF Transcript_64455/g.171935 Transcript_64455/m.171935 type:complete len:219 (-) Transcript_64455:118-774(-)|eukprot:CAMPEP_0171218738 /NCGR_PEP_ID=MMETSP0790-20130122/33355_1 /TAXON_ID=2925 /ORGANISM="Alexandrium catenella, Strain OF101" /LENGTH=218 /DNA_ID=CAMNT_0011684567 /DNA_START=81 /DNA_END=737 /DNA_ORIENTATION=-